MKEKVFWPLVIKTKSCKSGIKMNFDIHLLPLMLLIGLIWNISEKKKEFQMCPELFLLSVHVQYFVWLIHINILYTFCYIIEHFQYWIQTFCLKKFLQNFDTLHNHLHHDLLHCWMNWQYWSKHFIIGPIFTWKIPSFFYTLRYIVWLCLINNYKLYNFLDKCFSLHNLI